MQCRKEEVGGKLYLAYQYSYGVIRRQNPRERAERRKVTSEAKRKINALNRRFELMKLVSVNFTPGRDLFVEFRSGSRGRMRRGCAGAQKFSSADAAGVPKGRTRI